MMMTYSEGIVEALILSREKNTLRVALRGEEDSRIHKLIEDAGLSAHPCFILP
jgi:hypothetical protein